MEFATPAFEQARAALVSLFQAQANDFLRAMGADLLAETAFVPITRGDPYVETVCVAYSGANRDPDALDYRDSDLLLTVNLWAFGPNDVAAEQRAIQVETALIACLDQDFADHYDTDGVYVNGTMQAPPSVGPTRCVTPEREDAPDRMWHAVFPVLCPLRTARPEFAPIPAEPQ